MSNMKKIQIYKRDKWNMVNAEVQGSKIVVREISDQWGEESHTFVTRPEMLDWAEKRFTPERFNGTEEERLAILEAFKEV
ncbi:hypothetical protein ACFFK0_28530 [Paenibacillus chartarius]|uniref:Phage protein n=1 Tax=Paenibacillus chartarius TaxID=747481 RepID=A0ABV6DUQ2_9BACL